MIYRSVNDLDSPFVALADPTRRHVVEMLRQGPRRASELAAGSGMSRPAMSRHLKVLRRAGLVQSRKEERYIYYSVRRDTATALVRLLTACC